MIETRQRSFAKAALWRIIGIAWTWIGAYLILGWLPEGYRSAGLAATLIVVYHHSTRMLVYYAYERMWDRVRWGRLTQPLGKDNRQESTL